MGNKSKAPLQIYSTLHICLIRHASITCSSITIYVCLPLSRCVLFYCSQIPGEDVEKGTIKSRSWLLSLALVSSFSRPSITQFLPARGWRMTTSLKEVTELMHLWIISHYYSSVPTYNVSSFIALSALGTYPRDFFESPAFLPLLAPSFSRLSYYYQQCIFWPTISHALDWIWKARRALKIKHIVQW